MWHVDLIRIGIRKKIPEDEVVYVGRRLKNSSNWVDYDPFGGTPVDRTESTQEHKFSELVHYVKKRRTHDTH